MRVRVYRNLNATSEDERWSILNFEPSSDNYGIVQEHSRSVILSGASFKVQDGGFENFQESGVKNVHAFAQGSLLGTNVTHDGSLKEATYDPQVMKAFFLKESYRPIESADRVIFDETGMYVYNETVK